MEREYSLNVLGLIKWATGYLSESDVIKPRLNAEQILSHYSGRSRVDLYAYPEWPVPTNVREAFEQAVRRRAGHEPLQYIVGFKGFRHLEFSVDPRVLIPRPETETLVETALEIAKGLPGHPVVVDIGTGSGCIALSIARECPAAVVHASDICPEALEVAMENAQRLSLDGIILFHLGDLLGALPEELRGQCQLIVSNPPYISELEFPLLPPEVRRHEPRESLVAGPLGTEIHLRLMEEASSWLSRGGWLVMEGGEHQVGALVERAGAQGYSQPRVIHDLNRLPRIIEMQWNQTPPPPV